MKYIDVREILNNIPHDTNLVVVDNSFNSYKVKELLRGVNNEVILVTGENNSNDILIKDLLDYVKDKDFFSAKLDIGNLSVENIYYSNELNSVVFSVI